MKDELARNAIRRLEKRVKATEIKIELILKTFEREDKYIREALRKMM